MSKCLHEMRTLETRGVMRMDSSESPVMSHMSGPADSLAARSEGGHGSEPSSLDTMSATSFNVALSALRASAFFV
jgi:hypothetical protein